MVKVGYVTSTNGEYAMVVFKRQGGCGDSCASCKLACASADVTTEIRNTLGAKVGDQVKVEMREKAFNKMILWVYAFPLVMLLIGIGLGYKIFGSLGYSNTEVLSSILGLAALVISYSVLHQVSKRTVQKQEYTLQMITIIK